MTRETWIFPREGGAPYKRGEEPAERRGLSGATILPDLPDFVSPIDGKLYSGRAGLREHCRRHDVVPNAELKGLPTLTAVSDTRDPSQIKQDRALRKERIIQEVNRRYR